jgi:hypothetical protein
MHGLCVDFACFEQSPPMVQAVTLR